MAAADASSKCYCLLQMPSLSVFSALFLFTILFNATLTDAQSPTKRAAADAHSPPRGSIVVTHSPPRDAAAIAHSPPRDAAAIAHSTPSAHSPPRGAAAIAHSPPRDAAAIAHSPPRGAAIAHSPPRDAAAIAHSPPRGAAAIAHSPPRGAAAIAHSPPRDAAAVVLSPRSGAAVKRRKIGGTTNASSSHHQKHLTTMRTTTHEGSAIGNGHHNHLLPSRRLPDEAKYLLRYYSKIQNGKNGRRNGQHVVYQHRHASTENVQQKLKQIENYDASMLVSNANVLQVLIDDAVDWAQSNGLIMRTCERQNKSDVAQIGPFTLFPTAFPRQQFQQAVDVQTAMQLLYFRITSDIEFLRKVHEDVIKTDKLVQSFMDIIERVHREGIRQPITLFFQRADYMLHSKNTADQQQQQQHNSADDVQEYELKQIEVNGCALGGAGIIARTTALHQRMLKKAGFHASKQQVPDNGSDQKTAEALYHAWQVFGNNNAVVLFLVDTNSDVLQFDRRLIQYAFERVSHDNVDVVRLNLTECTEKLFLDPVDFSLRIVDDGRVVAVVFNQVLMLGSSPSHMELEARLMIERSTAIKAPSLVFAISHSKKIQQVLSRPGMVEHFFPGQHEAHVAAQIRATFAGLWGFEADASKNEQLIQMAMKNPERFVLKPIGEGCGAHFNYFDEQIPAKLAQLTQTELTEFILMEKLKPKVYRNHLIRAKMEPLLDTEVTTELGIYGCLLGNMSTGEILRNKQGGHIFKTKLATENEGGICAGTGVFDTPFLVDIN